MANLINGRFELGGDGVATGWEFFALTTGSEALPLESFEGGWGNTETDPVLVANPLGGGEQRESFERLWGPADGSNSDLPDAVPVATYTENASFQPFLTQISAGPPFENFDSWVTSTYVLDFDDVSSVSTTPENFEGGWDNDTFYETLIDGVTLITTTFYEFDPQSIENFDAVRIVDGHELITILDDPPPAGKYSAFISGVEFSSQGEVGDTKEDIAIALASVIDTSTYPYAAAQWLAESAFYVRNLSTTPMLIRVEGPVGDGSEIRVTTPLIISNFWLMPLE